MNCCFGTAGATGPVPAGQWGPSEDLSFSNESVVLRTGGRSKCC